MERFPDAKYTAVGAFIFLRFFCPAIVAPEVEGLVATPPSKEMRRGLLLIAKVIQNLANNVLFGAKEPYMFPLIDFLTNNIYYVTTFLREISVCLLTCSRPCWERAWLTISRRSHQLPWRLLNPGSRLNLAPAWPFIGFCTSIGIMCASG